MVTIDQKRSGNTKSYRTIRACRICKGQLKQIYSLGNLAISTFVKKPDQNIGYAPLTLVECTKCSLLQLKHTAPQELLYSGHYWYRSSFNKIIKDDLEDIVKKVIALTKPEKNDIFCDIGANDGFLLSRVHKKLIRVAVEPAKNLLAAARKNSDQLFEKMWEDVEWNLPKAKIVTAIGMFYDSDDPNIFIKKIKEILREDGVFVAQLMTLWPMLKNNDVGNICHEHLEYYSYKSLVYLYERNGLEIFKVEKNSINGGSYRLYARHYKKGSTKVKEPKADYKNFIKNIEKNKRQTMEVLENLSSHGLKIYGFGASTKGNTVLQYYGINLGVLKGIIDISKEKLGKYTVGTKIPIVSAKHIKNADALFVLPWGFIDYFKKKEKAYVKAGGKFIVSTPKYKIV